MWVTCDVLCCVSSGIMTCGYFCLFAESGPNPARICCSPNGKNWENLVWEEFSHLYDKASHTLLFLYIPFSLSFLVSHFSLSHLSLSLPHTSFFAFLFLLPFFVSLLFFFYDSESLSHPCFLTFSPSSIFPPPPVMWQHTVLHTGTPWGFGRIPISYSFPFLWFFSYSCKCVWTLKGSL